MSVNAKNELAGRADSMMMATKSREMRCQAGAERGLTIGHTESDDYWFFDSTISVVFLGAAILVWLEEEQRNMNT